MIFNAIIFRTGAIDPKKFKSKIFGKSLNKYYNILKFPVKALLFKESTQNGIISDGRMDIQTQLKKALRIFL